MKSISRGRAMLRERSAMNMAAPLSTPMSSGARPGVVAGDRGAELGHPGLEVTASTTTSPRSGLSIRCWLPAVRRHPCKVTERADGSATPVRAPARARHGAGGPRGRPPTSQARASPRATRGPGRRWRRRAGAARPRPAASGARPDGRGGSGAAARALASVGSRAAASSSRSSASARSSVGLPGEHGHDVALGDRVEQRQELVAHPVAAVSAGRRCVGSCTGSSPRSRAQRVGVGAAQAADRVLLRSEAG